MNLVEIESAWGATLVRAHDKSGMEHRFWFDETDAGRIVLCAYIMYVEETEFRDYVPEREWTVPDPVREALIDRGLDAETIYDTRGMEV